MTISVVDWSAATTGERQALLARPVEGDVGELTNKVGEIITCVRQQGDRAVASFTMEFDGVFPTDFAVDEFEFEEAEQSLDSEQVEAIDIAIRNVRRFHEAQIPNTVKVETSPGVLCERVSHPIDAVGLYVPAGTAPLPSAAIMLAVPAVIAECPTVVLCTPPGSDGCANPAVLVAARRSGVEQVFKIGGAQAIAAMAFGTETVPKVDKVFGPGNTWVTEAKSQVSVQAAGAAIDMPAGPSEVLVIADATANAEFIAADLLSQAEHGPDSQVLLLTNCRELARDVQQQLDLQLERLPRRQIASRAIENSAVILVETIGAAVNISNRYAPEHLILQVENPRQYLSCVRNAGSVFLGKWAPEAAGDYCSGTNHVLPTYGHARTYSGLSVDQFLRSMTVQELSSEGLASIAQSIVTLARLEGLHAHAQAVTCRLRSKGGEP